MYTPGPWTADKQALSIWAPNAKIGGETKVFDVRGWGYLTGGGNGALGLDHVAARNIQLANAKLAAAAPDLLEALGELVDAWPADSLPPHALSLKIAYAINKATV